MVTRYMKPIGEMAEPYGEAMSFHASITGEMQVADVPLAPWADLDALKAGDQDSLEVVVEVPAGKSKRKWNYKPEALQKIVGEVMSQGLPGFLGHQKPENVDTEFPQPVTHWVGAKFENGRAYFRGVVDKSASDLKRWIRAKVIRTVSIFGYPKLTKIQGETHVVDYKPMSIDWTPLGRAGMPTRIVATGEIDDIDNNHGGGTEMTWKEYVVKLKAMLQSGEVTAQQICGEMGWTAEQLARILDEDWVNRLTGEMAAMGEIRKTVEGNDPVKVITHTFETLGKVKEALGVTGEMDVVAAAAEAKKALDEKSLAGRESLVNEVLKEKVTGEMAQGLVRKMLQVPENATKEQVAGEIDKLLADETVKATIGGMYIDTPPPVGGGGNTSGAGILRKRTSSI